MSNDEMGTGRPEDVTRVQPENTANDPASSMPGVGRADETQQFSAARGDATNDAYGPRYGGQAPQHGDAGQQYSGGPSNGGGMQQGYPGQGDGNGSSFGQQSMGGQYGGGPSSGGQLQQGQGYAGQGYGQQNAGVQYGSQPPQRDGYAHGQNAGGRGDASQDPGQQYSGGQAAPSVNAQQGWAQQPGAAYQTHGAPQQYGQPGAGAGTQQGWNQQNQQAGQVWGQAPGQGSNGAAQMLGAQGSSRSLGRIALFVALGTQVLVMLGAIGPWASIFGMSVSGLEGDGSIVLVLSLIAVVVEGVVLVGKLPRKALWGAAGAAAICALIGMIDAGRIGSMMAWGLLFVLFFGLVSTAAAVVAALKR